MYDQDTYFHLSPLGQAGLLVISPMLGALALWLAWRLLRRRRWPTRLLGALGIFVVFEWLSPQVYYLWYLVVIDGLPLQWVIAPWPDPVGSIEVLGLQAGATLSAHSRALLGWALIALALVAWRLRPPTPDH